MTEWANLLFSFKGRINRARYWAAVGILTFITTAIIALTISTMLSATSGASEDDAKVVVIVACLIPVFLSGLAIGVKRLHDRDRSAHWMIVFYFLPSILGSIAEIPEESGATLTPSSFALSMLAIGLSFWGLAELGILKGTEGPNKYGDDPLATPNQT